MCVATAQGSVLMLTSVWEDTTRASVSCVVASDERTSVLCVAADQRTSDVTGDWNRGPVNTRYYLQEETYFLSYSSRGSNFTNWIQKGDKRCKFLT